MDDTPQQVSIDEALPEHINTIVARYNMIVEKERPSFTRNEWCVLCDALNGCWMPGMDDDGLSVQVLWTEVYDADRLDGLGDKWQVDARALAVRLRDMRFAQLIAIAETVTRFWNHSELPTDEALRQAGVELGVN